MRIASFLAGFFLSFAGGALAQAPKDAAKGPSATLAMSVKAVAARIAPAVDEVGAVGTLRADEAVSIRPEIAGRIAEIRFNEGQNIARGAVLVKLDPTELAAVLASSVAQARLDKQRLERSEDLYKKNFISQQALDESRSGYARSLAKQKEDEARLAKTEMRASFPGVAGLRQVSEGQYVAAGADIARLEKIDQLKLDFRIPESYIGKLKVGQPVKVLVDAYAERVFTGSVYAIEPGVDEQTRTIQLRARLTNLELRLRPGMFARVRVQLGVREKAIWIPEAAIVPKGRDTTVFRVLTGPDGGGKVDVVRVQTGMRKVGEVEIITGLAAGDLVVTEGTQKIGAGSAVVLMGAEPPKK
ncbi:MAG: efflux RND transporter periplasmic adaptor subunit [Betaproteobacteria bacterium]|nr:efflux RND transporter periplasmic adaptor subunit [Betaproteobacteria bacterium]MSQ88436.1 efflux RND transporter periplasmic adaptor subunit [Betaproteobacteria bacterium]